MVIERQRQEKNERERKEEKEEGECEKKKGEREMKKNTYKSEKAKFNKFQGFRKVCNTAQMLLYLEAIFQSPMKYVRVSPESISGCCADMQTWKGVESSGGS